MNPQDHDGRVDSPFIERAESADVIDLTDTDTMPVVDVLPAPVNWVPGSSPMPSLLPRRTGPDTWLGFAAGLLAVAVLVFGALAVGGTL